MKCPTCKESQSNHDLKPLLGIGCWCKNCYWCGHQIQLRDFAIDMDHDDALEMNNEVEAERNQDYALDQMVAADIEHQEHGV